MKIARPFLIVFFVLVFLFSGFMVLRDLSAQKQEIDEFQDLAALVAIVTEPESTVSVSANEETATDTPVAASQRNLDALFEQNPDCVGWIYIDGTKVNYPLMHTPENPEKYLRKSFSKKYSTAGVPFIEGRCTQECDNLVVYGHNMRNGTMFADVTKYRSNDFCAEHPVVEIETAQGLKQYAVFAVAQVKNDDNWYRFHSAADEAEYNRQVAQIQERALYDTGITPKYGQQLLTLSTCYGASKSDRILVICAEIV